MKSHKKIIIFASALVLVAVGVFAVLQATHTIHFFESAAQKQKQQSTQYQKDTKAATQASNGNPTSTNSKGEPTAGSGTYTPPNNASNITLTPSQQGSQVVITTKLAGYSDGSCALTITNGSQTFTQDVQVIYQSQFATCAGFSVPVSKLGAGTWNISLSVTSGGITTNKTATLEVQ